MEMPTPCNNCESLFDLHDGVRSQSRPGVVICEDCGDREREQMERAEEIEDLNNNISDARHTLTLAKERLKELGEPFVETQPVDIILFCPRCQTQHIDKPQHEKGWENPPHRSHECQSCGIVWRPADIPTNGVAHIKTRGSQDSFFMTTPYHKDDDVPDYFSTPESFVTNASQ